ncbi:6749_t:CDS:2, partial [Entrophospora sp. SA101]
MVRIINDYTLACKKTDTVETCWCDFRVNIYECQQEKFWITINLINLPFFISINITCLILELYPSVLWAEVVHHLSDEMLSSLGILYLIIYSTPSGFQYNFKLTRKEGDDISYAKKSMDIKILDIIGILLMVLPIAIQLPLAAFA